MFIRRVSLFETPGIVRLNADPTSSSAPSSCKDIDNCRTLLQIVWSCVSVLIACTWVSVHPNVPGPDEGSWKIFQRKIGLMLIALIAPELLVLWAARQWFAARKLSKRYEDQGWTMSHAFFALMGGFALYEGRQFLSVLRFIPSSSSDRRRILENFGESGRYPLNPVSTHDDDAHVPLSTGSLADDLPKQSTDNLEDHLAPASKDAVDDHSFVAHYKFIGRVSEREVKDRSRSDGFAKLVALGQTSWFVVQLFARWAEDLPVTELEVMTLAFAAMNVLMYFFWWDKPQGVGCHIRVQRGNRNEDDIHPPAAPIKQNKGWLISSWNWLQENINHLLHKIDEWCLDHFSESFTDANIFVKIVLVTIWIIFSPFFAVTNAILIESDAEDLIRALPSDKVSSFERPAGLEPKNAIDKFIAYGAAVMFGAIHCAAWTSKFPSTAEEMLWKVCTLLVTSAPIYLAFCNMITHWSYNVADSWWGNILILAYIAAVLFYIFARLSLLVQPFLALRDLPPDAFKAVQWTTFMPHI
ncbi:hypothetical protein GYMLUDRAFT_265520 [Collybiopsis luxurians FD-317 M1]|uniref:Uncharacterized protein n=1 Tax=Collybiopsis luxurians FD-317 M1 TaxID=944289 RepID=A0A0D0C2S7_9AGAR|nr:hypothetical protein GYMLUDRAFT_265520 [Collybiopsis luxurians FD-317 M1]